MRRALTRSAILIAAVAAAFPALAQSGGDVDFTRTIALGDGLMAGELNAGLEDRFQRHNIPSLVRQQAGATTDFTQPLFTAPGFSLEAIPSEATGLFTLQFFEEGVPCTPFIPEVPPLVAGARIGRPPFDNMAVPLATVSQIVNTRTGNYFGLVTGARRTVMQWYNLYANNPSFGPAPTFTFVWAGNMDAFRAIGSGLVVERDPPDQVSGTLTTLSAFERDYQIIIDAVDAAGSKMAVATIPFPDTTPWVTEILPVFPDPNTCEPFVQADGSNIPLVGPDGDLTTEDRILLPAAVFIEQGFGVPGAFGNGEPLRDEDTLVADELATIVERIEQYNYVIEREARLRGSAFVDTAALTNRAATEGLTIGGIKFTTEYLSGGLVSYDGLFPTPLGYAIFANEFIKSINTAYGSDIPLIDLYPYVFGGEDIPTLSPVSMVKSAQSITPELAAGMRAMTGISPEEMVLIKQMKAGLPVTPIETDPVVPSDPLDPSLPIRPVSGSDDSLSRLEQLRKVRVIDPSELNRVRARDLGDGGRRR